jgi:hypothetical protein
MKTHAEFKHPKLIARKKLTNNNLLILVTIKILERNNL